MSYWKYLKQNRIWLLISIVSLFAMIFIAGFFMGVDSLMELKYLAFIVGIPVAVVLIGNYIKYKRDA